MQQKRNNVHKLPKRQHTFLCIVTIRNILQKNLHKLVDNSSKRAYNIKCNQGEHLFPSELKGVLKMKKRTVSSVVGKLNPETIVSLKNSYGTFWSGKAKFVFNSLTSEAWCSAVESVEWRDFFVAITIA